ncbi:hypothetical protein EI94DRAFT_1751238 [Lactarius quietus]|nr:hypothetical protein EI94DRAFT_1751238 [Lactarius quietus]
MTDVVARIMVELISILALAKKQISRGRLKQFAKKLLGHSEIETILRRLDRLTQEEARMTVAQTLAVVHGLLNNMKVVMDGGEASTSRLYETLVAMQAVTNEINRMKRASSRLLLVQYKVYLSYRRPVIKGFQELDLTSGSV